MTALRAACGVVGCAPYRAQPGAGRDTPQVNKTGAWSAEAQGRGRQKPPPDRPKAALETIFWLTFVILASPHANTQVDASHSRVHSPQTTLGRDHTKGATSNSARTTLRENQHRP